jgi:hypothetical protein
MLLALVLIELTIIVVLLVALQFNIKERCNKLRIISAE